MHPEPAQEVAGLRKRAYGRPTASQTSFFGQCQDEQLCTSTGTLMSYSHACPGGMANRTAWFHPVAAEVMRLAVRASCLPAAGR